MPTYNIEVLQQAIEAHKSGNLQDAEVLYRKILQTQPKHPDANHNLVNNRGQTTVFRPNPLAINPPRVQ